MDEGRDNSVVPPPLQSFCSPTAVRPCSRTTTGRRCLISCCIELGDGIHFSHNSFCNLNSATFDLFIHPFTSRSASLHPRLPNSKQVTMLRLRHCMRCRRGSTRSRPQRPPSSSNSESSSPSSDYFASRHPNTRSGRGTSHSASFRMASSDPATPASLASNSPQTAQFYFNCTMNRPRIIATISISFREETQMAEANTHSGGKANESAQDAAAKEQQKDMHKGKGPIDEDKDSHRAGRSKHGTGSHADKPDDEDDMEAYKCLITEEPPPHHAI